jgi:superfamily II DNA or RNA helicase
MKPFKRGDIQNNISSQSYTRGKAYYDEKRVTTLKIENEEDDLVELSSTVRGSGGSSYRQQIEIDWSDDDVAINGDCDCPVGYNCKHVAAACLKYLAEFHLSTPGATAKTDTACFTWLDEFTASSTSHQQQSAANNERLFYLLKPAKQAGKLQITFCTARTLKNGNLSKPRTVQLHNISDSYYPAPYVQPIDQEIGKLLRANNDSWGLVWLHGELGFLAISKIIQTGRCHWLELETPPLRPGEERELTLHWQKDAKGNAALKVEIIPNGQLLLTMPPLYLSHETHTVGPLSNAPYSLAQLEKLLHAPTVPAKIITEFSQKMARKIPTTLLPPPQKVETDEVIGEHPIPCLHLSAREAQGQLYHILRMRYRYGAHEIMVMPEGEITQLDINGKLTLIQRNLNDEIIAAEEIKALGFEALIDYNEHDLIFLSMNTESPMEGVLRWRHFLTEVIPTLRQRGWQVELDTSFNMNFHEANQWQAEIEENDNDWFGLRFDVEINGQPVALLPLVAQALRHYPPQQLPDTLMLPLGGAQYLNIAREQIQPIIDTLYELYDRDTLQADGSLRLSRYDAARLTDLEQTSDVQWRGGAALRKLGQQLKEFQGIKNVEPPHGLKATLRHYQQQGLNWLQFLREYGFGGILADDMGLGKTVQTLAHLLLEKEQGRINTPVLIIAPTSLMSNWRREAQQFSPALKVLVLQGPERHQHFDKIAEHDIVLSTYPLLPRDEEQLLAHHYHALILDEAQIIKNPKAKASQIVRQIKADQRLCLTGTPMENHLGELWALFDFLMPGFLGDTRQFNTLFRTPIEIHGDGERRQRLAQRVAPFMLRRTKDEVVKELPEKTEIIRTVTLDKKQAALYESIRLSMESKVREAIASKGLARSHITILDALLKLRQACCDPRLLPLAQAQKVKESAKLELLMEMVPEMVEEGRRILLFSQFTKMLGLIEGELSKHNIPYTKLTGQTRNRDEAIERFKSGEVQVFLISLKAGGVGLNLTEADTVIHYDPWWNPAVERQATDRAHRIGQQKAVFVYKLVTENSVEEKIVAMQARKQALAQGVYNKTEQGEELTITAADMEQLFAPL